MAHYLPWFQARPYHETWGWHWTMNHFNPDKIVQGEPEAASHDRPLIGLYDSGDPDVLECQVLLMKLAGIDGVILDWYGPDDFLDYGLVQENSLKLLPWLKRAGLHFAVCYEDQAAHRMVDAGRVKEAIPYGQSVMRWLGDHWFTDPAYFRVDGRPLFLVFGPQFYKPEAWPKLFSDLKQPPAFFTLANRIGPAEGGFDWPYPAPGHGVKDTVAFYARAAAWPAFIPAAYPGFHDIYAEAGVGKSYGFIDEQGGQTYTTTLEMALRSRAEVVQLVTWNDWGEGTEIEPSVRTGYRYLETTQRLRQQLLQPSFHGHPADLRLPVRLFTLRKQAHDDRKLQAQLDRISQLLFAGKTAAARRALDRVRPKSYLR